MMQLERRTSNYFSKKRHQKTSNKRCACSNEIKICQDFFVLSQRFGGAVDLTAPPHLCFLPHLTVIYSINGTTESCKCLSISTFFFSYQYSRDTASFGMWNPRNQCKFWGRKLFRRFFSLRIWLITPSTKCQSPWLQFGVLGLKGNFGPSMLSHCGIFL